MQKYTRPLEKLTPNTVSLERIIIKAIYDTVFIHRKICPGVLFLQFGSMPDSTPPRSALSSTSAQTPQDTGRDNRTPLGQRLPQRSPSGATAAAMPQEAKRLSERKRHRRGEHPCSTKTRAVPARSEQGNRAQRPSLRHCGRAPSTALRVQLRGHQARI